jgi:hypothetical protein
LQKKKKSFAKFFFKNCDEDEQKKIRFEIVGDQKKRRRKDGEKEEA